MSAKVEKFPLLGATNSLFDDFRRHLVNGWLGDIWFSYRLDGFNALADALRLNLDGFLCEKLSTATNQRHNYQRQTADYLLTAGNSSVSNAHIPVTLVGKPPLANSILSKANVSGVDPDPTQNDYTSYFVSAGRLQ
jgi:hypothetical protein